MKKLYSVLQVFSYNPNHGKTPPFPLHCIVVCETKNDDDEVRRLAKQSGFQVLVIVSPTANIYLNDFE